MGGHGEIRASRDGQPSKIDTLRAEGKLPTASSSFSFSNPPGDLWNRTPVFSAATRDNHAGSASFLGTFYYQAKSKGVSFPGPGTYELDRANTAAGDRATVNFKATSCTRPSTFARRSKVSCAPMGGARISASLAGADQLLLEQGPDFYDPPKTEIDEAASRRGFLTSGFASETSRFVEPHMINGKHDARKFDRKIPRRPKGTVSYPERLKTAPWVPGLPHPPPHLARGTSADADTFGATSEARGPGGVGLRASVGTGVRGGGGSAAGVRVMYGTALFEDGVFTPEGFGGLGGAWSIDDGDLQQLPNFPTPRTLAKQRSLLLGGGGGAVGGSVGNEGLTTDGGGQGARQPSSFKLGQSAQPARPTTPGGSTGGHGSDQTMAKEMREYSFRSPQLPLSQGFVPPDRYRHADSLSFAAPGRDRRLVAAERTTDSDGVKDLELFKPPNTTALRFY